MVLLVFLAPYIIYMYILREIFSEAVPYIHLEPIAIYIRGMQRLMIWNGQDKIRRHGAFRLDNVWNRFYIYEL